MIDGSNIFSYFHYILLTSINQLHVCKTMGNFLNYFYLLLVKRKRHKISLVSLLY